VWGKKLATGKGGFTGKMPPEHNARNGIAVVREEGEQRRAGKKAKAASIKRGFGESERTGGDP